MEAELIDEEVALWTQVARELAIEVATPGLIQLSNGTEIRVTAHIKTFGDRNGMAVDAEWSVIEPFTNDLVESGYGYSAVSIGPPPLDQDGLADIIEMLADWGWAGEKPAPSWLPPAKEDRE